MNNATGTFTLGRDELRPLVKELIAELVPASGVRLRFSTAEAAEMLGISEASLLAERRLGRIEGICGMRGRWFWVPEELRRYAMANIDSGSRGRRV